jgi:hypothetical protein
MVEMLKWGAAAMLLTLFATAQAIGRWRCWQGQGAVHALSHASHQKGALR